MIDQYAAVKDGIADDKAWLEKEKAELVVLQEQTTSKKNSVETLVNEKSAELKKVNFYVMEYPLTPFTSTAGSGGAGGTGAGSPGAPWVSRLLTHPCPM